MTAEPRPRILIVTRNLPPLVGGMERLNWHMAEELARCAEVHVVGPEGAGALAPSGVMVCEAPLKPLWKFLLRARALSRRDARTWKPHLVIAGSGLTAPLVRAAARTCGAKTAVYVHGLDVAVKHPLYRAIWLPALRRMDRVIANSRATAALCRDVGIDPARIGIVHPGVDLPEKAILLDPPSQAKEEGQPVLHGSQENSPPSAGRGSRAARGDVCTPFGTKGRSDSERARSATAQRRGDEPGLASPVADFRQHHNLGNRPLLLSVGRLSARKGLREFVANALPQIAAAHPDVMLLIVGDAPKDALHAAAQTPDSIRAVAAKAGLADNLRFLGTITDYAELGRVYRAADVHVFPVREIPGDPEGFGMVAVEAAAHGLPTIAFATGGVPDAVIEGETGSLVSPGNYNAFASSVNEWLKQEDSAAMAQHCAAAAERFSWQHFGESLRSLLSLPEVRA